MVYLAIHDRVMGFKNVWPMHLICFQILLIFTILQSKSKSETRVLEAHKHQHNTRILIIQISQSRVSASLLLSSASKTKRSSLSLSYYLLNSEAMESPGTDHHVVGTGEPNDVVRPFSHREEHEQQHHSSQPLTGDGASPG